MQLLISPHKVDLQIFYSAFRAWYFRRATWRGKDTNTEIKLTKTIDRNSFTNLNQIHQGYITKINKFHSVLGKNFQFIVKTTQHTLCGQSWPYTRWSVIVTVMCAVCPTHRTQYANNRTSEPRTYCWWAASAKFIKEILIQLFTVESKLLCGTSHYVGLVLFYYSYFWCQ